MQFLIIKFVQSANVCNSWNIEHVKLNRTAAWQIDPPLIQLNLSSVREYSIHRIILSRCTSQNVFDRRKMRVNIYESDPVVKMKENEGILFGGKHCFGDSCYIKFINNSTFLFGICTKLFWKDYSIAESVSKFDAWNASPQLEILMASEDLQQSGILFFPPNL